MSSVVREWLGPFVEERIRELLEQNTSWPVKIKNEDGDESENSFPSSQGVSDDGSNLRLKVPVDKSKIRIVQILKFNHAEAPVKASASDGHSTITVRFSTTAVQEYAKNAMRRITEDNLYGLLTLRKFEIVISKYGPIDQAISLFVEDFTIKRSFSNGALGRPEPLVSRSTVKNLLSSLREHHGIAAATTHSDRRDATPLTLVRDIGNQDNANVFASQAPFFSQRSAPKSDKISGDLGVLHAPEPSTIGIDELLTSHQSGTARHESLLRLLNPVVTLKSQNNAEKIVTTRHSNGKEIVSLPEVSSMQKIPNVTELVDNATISYTSKTSAAKSSSSRLTPDKSCTDIAETIHTRTEDASRKLQSFDWYRMMHRISSLSLPPDQEELMERKGALIQPGSILPIANIPTPLLDEFNKITDECAEKKSIESKDETLLKSQFDSPNKDSDVTALLIPAVRLDGVQGEARLQNSISSSEGLGSDLSEDSERLISSQDWPLTSPIRQRSDELPPDTPYSTNPNRAHDLDGSNSDLEMVTLVPLQISSSRLANFGGKQHDSKMLSQQMDGKLRKSNTKLSQLASHVPGSNVTDPKNSHSLHSDQFRLCSTEELHTSTNSMLSEQSSLVEIPASVGQFNVSPVKSNIGSESPSVELTQSNSIISVGKTVVNEQIRLDGTAATQTQLRSDSKDTPKRKELVQVPNSLVPDDHENISLSSESLSELMSGKPLFFDSGDVLVTKREIIHDNFPERSAKRPKLNKESSLQAESYQTPMNIAREERRAFMAEVKEQYDPESLSVQGSLKVKEPSPSGPGIQKSPKVVSSSPLNLADLHTKFTIAYPDYTGSLKHFNSLCRTLMKLRQNNNAPHHTLWDDFVIRQLTDYAPYVTRSLLQGDDPVTYEAYYRDEIEHPLYEHHILSAVLFDAIIDANHGPRAIVSTSSSMKSEISTPERGPVTDSSHAMSARSGRIGRDSFERSSTKTPNTKKIEDSPLTSSAGGLSNPIQIDENDSESLTQTTHRAEKVSVLAPSLNSPSSLNPLSSLQDTPRRSSRVLPWAKSVAAHHPIPSSHPQSNNLVSESIEIGKRSLRRQGLSSSQSAMQKDSSKVEPPYPEPSSLWWKDDNTPFKEFARSFGDLQSLRGYLPTIGSKPLPNSFARKLNISKWNL